MSVAFPCGGRCVRSVLGCKSLRKRALILLLLLANVHRSSGTDSLLSVLCVFSLCASTRLLHLWHLYCAFGKITYLLMIYLYKVHVWLSRG